MKRTKYLVRTGDEVARFSLYQHAMEFARAQGDAEVSCVSGLVGQYHGGKPTTEFTSHHISVFGEE